MVFLPAKTVRDSLGIDTIERGIAWAILYLRAANNHADLAADFPYRNSVRFSLSTSATTNRIISEVKLRYDNVLSLRSAADFLANIKPFSSVNPGNFLTTSPASPDLAETMPPDPAFVDSAEKYLGWLCYLLAASTLPSLEYVKIAPLEEASEPTLSINISLPFNYQHWLVTGNLITSVNKLVDYYIDSVEEIPAANVILPSIQFWRDPVDTINDLKAVATGNLKEGAIVYVREEYSAYAFTQNLPNLPVGYSVVIPNDQQNNEGWVVLFVLDEDANGPVNWSAIQDKPTFATVATSGSYNDLTNKPAIPSAVSQLANDSQFINITQVPLKTVNNQAPDANGNVNITAALGEADWSTITNKPNFATVVTSGSYNDLTNKPTIPSVVSQLVNDVNYLTSVSWAAVLNKPSFATVAGTGSYNDLSDKPPNWTTSDVKTANFTAETFTRYPCNTSSSSFTLTLPANGQIWIFDAVGNSPTTGFGANALTIQATAGKTIMGDSSLVVDRGAIGFILELIGNDWRVTTAR